MTPPEYTCLRIHVGFQEGKDCEACTLWWAWVAHRDMTRAEDPDFLKGDHSPFSGLTEKKEKTP